MENFFNYIAKPMNPDDVDVWFRVNNIIPEKMDLYYDFSFSLYFLVLETYLGEEKSNETKVTLSDEDKTKHFDWCWNKTIGISKKKKLLLTLRGITTNTSYLFLLKYSTTKKKVESRTQSELFLMIYLIGKNHSQNRILI